MTDRGDSSSSQTDIKKQGWGLFLFDKPQWQLDFLPEYQAILKRPPASIGRYLGLSICFLFLFSIVWSVMCHMDIVASAQGKLSAIQGSKVIQSATFGEVVHLAVSNGDNVEEGDVLIKMDDTEQQAKLSALHHLIREVTIDIARFKALQTDEPEGRFIPPEGLTEAQISAARDRLRTSLYYYQVQVDGLKAQPEKHQEPKLSSTETRVKAFKSEYQEKVYSQLTKANSRLMELRANLVEVEEQIKALTVRSPVLGQVQELSINTLGAVIEPAQRLMVIVPRNIELQANVMILSKDVGFIHLEQAVEVKVDSFPYTRFGTIAGQISSIAKDAIVDKNAGLLYPATIRLTRQKVTVNDRVNMLRPGMHVTAEIKTGRRRIISYLLSPLQEYQSETLKER